MTRDEAGMVAGFEGVAFGVLVFVMGTLMVANAWGVIDAKLATTAAAREAARTYVEAPSDAAGRPAAEEAAREAIEAHGRNWDRATLDPPTADGHPADPFARCGRVTMTMHYRVPLAAIPLLGQAGSVFTVTSKHSEVVDPYRSGLAGAASCAP